MSFVKLETFYSFENIAQTTVGYWLHLHAETQYYGAVKAPLGR